MWNIRIDIAEPHLRIDAIIQTQLRLSHSHIQIDFSGQLIFPSGITVACAESTDEPQLEVWGLYNKVFFNSCVFVKPVRYILCWLAIKREGGKHQDNASPQVLIFI